MTDAAAGLASTQVMLGPTYQLLRELGRGGTATVYQARDSRNDQLVAVKVLHAAFAGSVDLQRFVREIHLATLLSHPGIVPVLDSGHFGDSAFFVMPYVSGESLADRMARQQRLPVSEAAAIALDVLDALAYAHAQNVIHRDIKPANIMLSDMHAMVADFGIGKAITNFEESSLTRTGMSVGTPAYMSLEQAAGDSDIDGRSDLFSLGVVLYEMISGKAPFAGPTVQAVIAARFTQTPAPLAREIADQFPALDDLLARAMARFREQRFATAEDFAAALKEAVDKG
jgi:eukaryotic-like serine/threonine-protein kinase